MDKNTTLGFILMGLLFIGFIYTSQPSEEQINAQRRYQDSIAKIMHDAEELEKEKARQAQLPMFNESDSDSLKIAKLGNKYGALASAGIGQEGVITLKNNLISVDISAKGGSISKVELLQYKTSDQEPLVLFDSKVDGTQFGLLLDAIGASEKVSTSDLIFLPSQKSESDVTFTMKAGEASLSFSYTLPEDSYMLNFDISGKNLQTVLKKEAQTDVLWKSRIKQQEKSHKTENRYTAIYYMDKSQSVDQLSETSDDKITIADPLRWVAFKDQFFSSVFITDEIKNANLTSTLEQDTSKYLKNYEAQMTLPIATDKDYTCRCKFFFGPNQYKLLKDLDKDVDSDQKLNLKKLVPLGWSIVRWVNQLFVIPVFNILGSFISSYGLIIFLLTLLVKLILFPLSYKSFLSTAKMRVLKPEIEKECADIPESDTMARQQKTMEIYNKVGVSPMGGCFPMLLQMPVLIALFYFFPTAIELRQQSFLWAADLSAYDPIITWSANIPIISYLFDNHISLFCILMTIANVASTKINMSASDTGQQQMPGMKYMMYFMPLMFLFIFNNYASGLCYYYLLSTLFTLLQTIVIRKFVNEERLLKKIHEESKKPKKKNAWMNSIIEMQKQALEQQKLKENK